MHRLIAAGLAAPAPVPAAAMVWLGAPQAGAAESCTGRPFPGTTVAARPIRTGFIFTEGPGRPRRLGVITAGRHTTNVAFGGPDGRTLFITSGTPGHFGIYHVDLRLPGNPY